MVDFFPYSDGDYSILSAYSGELVKVRKVGNSFKILKTNYETFDGVIELTAKPYNPLYYLIDIAEGSTPDRNGQEFPLTNPTITIYDTDILKITVLPADDTQEYPLIITDNTTLPLSGVQVGTIANNDTGNGTIRWYPGSGNTGFFYYLYADATSSPFGGIINVISNTQ